MTVIKGGVTAAIGFTANGIRAGIKKSGNKDLALLYSEVPAVAAGAFTTNKFEASPVILSKLHIRNKMHQAIIVNSGNANCANGSKAGYKAALAMVSSTAKNLRCENREVLTASTGIIGRALPINKIRNNIAGLVCGLSKKGGASFAEAIMTTDTVKKEFAVKVKLGSATVTIGGAIKGVGMLYPVIKTEKHATMLCFITTDAAISKAMLENALDEAVGPSFNMTSVDGDMSTNDTCFIMANGMAGNFKITKKDPNYHKFTGALKFLSIELAKMLARDGEGATKFIEITVRGAKSAEDASAAARKISASSLLKCAVSGEDPNWGRVAAAVGAAGIEFDPEKVKIKISDLAKHDVKITVDLKNGKSKAVAWTCDFSKEYVAINSEYST